MMIHQQDVDGIVKKKPRHKSNGCHREWWWHNMINTKTVRLLIWLNGKAKKIQETKMTLSITSKTTASTANY